MNAKNSWIQLKGFEEPEIYHISWSSSSDEDETKFGKNNIDKSSTAFKSTDFVHISSNDETPKKFIENPPAASQSNFIYIDEVTNPSKSNNISFKEFPIIEKRDNVPTFSQYPISPIIGKCNISPTFDKTIKSPIIGISDIFTDYDQSTKSPTIGIENIYSTSPIIGKHKTLQSVNKLKKKLNLSPDTFKCQPIIEINRAEKTYDLSQDMFESQPVIEINRDKKNCESLPVIEIDRAKKKHDLSPDIFESQPVIEINQLKTKLDLSPDIFETQSVNEINRLKKKLDLSPDVIFETQTVNEINRFKKKLHLSPDTFETRPVIKINRFKKKFDITSDIMECRPVIEVINTQKTVYNIDSESPSKSEYDIESVCSQDVIPIPTQEISETTTYTSGSSDYIAPKKRKRHKKSGYAEKAAKALQSQKNSMGIWKHEMYLVKYCNYDEPYVKSDLLRQFTISGVLVEFGATIITTVCNSMVLVSNEFVNIDKIIIGSVIKLYPPYTCNQINRGGEDINFYLNVSKVQLIE